MLQTTPIAPPAQTQDQVEPHNPKTASLTSGLVSALRDRDAERRLVPQGMSKQGVSGGDDGMSNDGTGESSHYRHQHHHPVQKSQVQRGIPTIPISTPNQDAHEKKDTSRYFSAETTSNSSHLHPTSAAPASPGLQQHSSTTASSHISSDYNSPRSDNPNHIYQQQQQRVPIQTEPIVEPPFAGMKRKILAEQNIVDSSGRKKSHQRKEEERFVDYDVVEDVDTDRVGEESDRGMGGER